MRACGELRTDCDEVFRKKKRGACVRERVRVRVRGRVWVHVCVRVRVRARVCVGACACVRVRVCVGAGRRDDPPRLGRALLGHVYNALRG